MVGAKMALWNGRRSPLPPGARWVEYLESTGTQWIDTGVYGDSNTVAELTFAMTDSARSDAGIFGARKGYQSDCFCILRVAASNGAFWMLYGDEGTGANYISSVIGNTTDWHTARLAKSWTIDNSSGTAGNYTFTTPTTLKVFAADMSASGRWYAKMRLASLKIYSNGTLVRDFIPVRKGTVGYLYDRVSGALFGNAGTGDFVVGPDVVPVEYIESHGTEYIDTGFKASNSTRVAVDFERKGGTANCWILGARNGTASATDKFALFCGINNNTAYAMLGSAAGQFSSATIKTGRHLLEMSLAGGVVVDSQVVTTYSASEQAEIFSAAYAMALFNLWNGSSLNNPFVGKYYVCDFWDNGDPVRKFLPIRVGSGSTWEGAMMDVLTRRVYRNQGTGAFGYGADLPLETLAN